MSKQGDEMELARILTCPICNKVCRKATTIIECIHTFCKKCITRKFEEENLRCCPVCNVDLGGFPLHKIKSDFLLQSITKKLTVRKPKTKDNTKQSNKNDEEVKPVSPDALLIKKIDQIPTCSITSPENASSQQLTKADQSGTRRSSRQRTILYSPLSLISDDDEDEYENPKSRVSNIRKVASRTKEDGSSSKSSMHQSSYKRRKNKHHNDKPCEDLCIDLETSNSSRLDVDDASNLASHSSLTTVTTTADDNGNEKNVKEDMNNKENESKPDTTTKKADEGQVRRRGIIVDLNLPSLEAVLEESSNVIVTAPIWFQLVPSEEQNTSVALPPLPSFYLRVKNADNMPASSIIRKYLVKKFGLQSEAEVEISMSGCPIPPEMAMKGLFGAWIQSQPRETVKVIIGSSAEEFIMSVSYRLNLTT